MKLMNSPLLRTLICMNVFLVFGLFLAQFVPLPDIERDDRSSSLNASLSEGLKPVSIDTATILARPLFHQNRRPPVPVAEAVAPQVIREKLVAPYALVGVMGASENQRTAYLQHTQTNETVVAKVGDTVGVWAVDTVGTNFITLVFEDERQVIELNGGG